MYSISDMYKMYTQVIIIIAYMLVHSLWYSLRALLIKKKARGRILSIFISLLF